MSNIKETVLRIAWQDITTTATAASYGLNDFPYLLTGDTGSGKSTFALLPILCAFKNKRVAFVQPTRANMGNARYEWNSKMRPVLDSNPRYTRYKGKYNSPTVATISEVKNLASGLFLFDAYQFLDIIYSGDVSLFHMIILDEQHLALQAQRTVLMYLRYAMPSRRYIVISATPDGQVTSASLPPGVAVTEFQESITAFDMHNQFLNNSYLHPGLYFAMNPSQVDFNVCFVLPTRKILDEFAERMRRAGVAGGRIFCITEDTELRAYSLFQASVAHGRNLILILPTVEAGLTIPMDIFVDPGFTYRTILENSILYDAVAKLTIDQSRQRIGRAGRVRTTRAFINMYRETVQEQESSDVYLEANSIVALVSLGVPAEKFKFVPAYRTYTRLHTLTESAAKAAVADNKLTPFASSYKYAADGTKFIECGGSATGFADLCRDDLKIFIANGPSSAPQKMMIALPLFDLTTTTFTPFSFVAPERQQDVIEALADTERAMIAAKPLREQIDLLTEVWDLFANLIVPTIRTGFNPGDANNLGVWLIDGDYPDKNSRMHQILVAGSELDYMITSLMRVTNDVEYDEVAYTGTGAGAQIADATATTLRDTEARQAHDQTRLGYQTVKANLNRLLQRAQRKKNAHDAAGVFIKSWPTTPAVAATPAVPAVPATATTPAVPAVPAQPATPALTLFDRCVAVYTIADAYRNQVLHVPGTTLTGALDNDLYDEIYHWSAGAVSLNSGITLPANCMVLQQSVFTPGANARYPDPSEFGARVRILTKIVGLTRDPDENQQLSDIDEVIDDDALELQREVDGYQSQVDAVDAQIAAHGVFHADPNPVMRAATLAHHEVKPILRFKHVTPPVEMSLMPAETYFLRRDSSGVKIYDTPKMIDDIMVVLRPRIALALLRQINPGRFVELTTVTDRTPLTHTWFWNNVH